MKDTEKTKVILRGTAQESLTSVVRECMEFCDWESWVRPDATVVLKPNLCSIVPGQMEKSNTHTELTAAVCEVLSGRTKRIFIGEADHLRRTGRQALECTGHLELARRYGAELVNFTDLGKVNVPCAPIGEIEMPRLLLEADVFITLPVLKTHALTYFTGSLKNQWGCVPQRNRILMHKYLDEMLVSLHRMLRPKMSLMDGIIAMEGRGPTNGNSRRLDLVMASQDSVALDASAMRLVGLTPSRARHVAMAAEQGLGRIRSEDIEVDGDWQRHTTQFKPGEKDWAIAGMMYMSQSPWFVKYVMENDYIFYPLRQVVVLMRRLGLVGNG